MPGVPVRERAEVRVASRARRAAAAGNVEAEGRPIRRAVLRLAPPFVGLGLKVRHRRLPVARLDRDRGRVAVALAAIPHGQRCFIVQSGRTLGVLPVLPPLSVLQPPSWAVRAGVCRATTGGRGGPGGRWVPPARRSSGRSRSARAGRARAVKAQPAPTQRLVRPPGVGGKPALRLESELPHEPARLRARCEELRSARIRVGRAGVPVTLKLSPRVRRATGNSIRALVFSLPNAGRSVRTCRRPAGDHPPHEQTPSGDSRGDAP